MKRRVGEKKRPEERSRTVSARLNPDYDEDRQALVEFDRMVSEGKSPREIITDALIRMSGVTPEMYHRRQQAEDVLEKLSSRLDTIDGIREGVDQIITLIENSLIDMLKNIKLEDPQGLRDFANHDEDMHGDLDMSEQFVRNAQKAARRTFKQRGND